MKIAIYPGSFDPFTKGHFDILETAAKIFDKVIILVANNSQKSYLLPVEVRVNLIKQSVKSIENVEVDSFDGLTVSYAKKHNASILIRGLRNVSDFEYETQMAKINNALDSDVTTIYIPSNNESNFISSSMIRELLLNKVDISQFVPNAVNEYFAINCLD